MSAGGELLIQAARWRREKAAVALAKYASENSILRGPAWERLITDFDRTDIALEALEAAARAEEGST